MSTKTLKVCDMPPRLKDACLERGFALNHELTPQDAVAEFSAWELGCKDWAYDIIGLYALALATATASEDKKKPGK